jgi:hypothetical protein
LRLDTSLPGSSLSNFRHGIHVVRGGGRDRGTAICLPLLIG